MVKYATPEFYVELDKKAEEMKQGILTAKTQVTCNGTAYYVANDGCDENDGKSPENAWKTLARVSDAEELKEGDAVFFRRGDLFRGTLQAKTGLTYSAYGEGEKPKFYAHYEDVAKPEKWVLYDKENMIWKFSEQVVDIGTIWFNGEEHFAVKKTAFFFEGKYYCREDVNKEFIVSEQLLEDFDIFCMAHSELDGNGIPKVQSPNCKGDLYLRYSGGNPGEVFDTIELSPAKLNIRIGKNHNIVFDNLCVKYGVSGFDANYADGITIKNCEIGCCGGALMTYFKSSTGKFSPCRWGNGFGQWGDAHNFTMKNNWIYECYDAGITPQIHGRDKRVEMYDIDMSENLIEKCCYSIEVFLSELAPENTDSWWKNVRISNNIMRFAGFGFGRQRPDSECSHIKAWDAENPAINFVISDNIFDRSTETLFHLGFKWGEGMVLRNNTYIQYPSGKFGRYGKNSAKELHYFAVRGVDKIAKDNFNDEGGKFYLAY